MRQPPGSDGTARGGFLSSASAASASSSCSGSFFHEPASGEHTAPRPALPAAPRAKNLANRRKHGLSFEEAAELFTSDYLEIFDAAHSQSEDRFVAIGPIARGLILVAWTERDDDTLRIISARPATGREQALYHSHMSGSHE